MDSIENFRLFDLLHRLGQMSPKQDVLAAKENGEWRKYSTREYIDSVNHLSYAFLEIGVKPGGKIGLISNNRPEWHFIDYACPQPGSINTPVYPNISEHDLRHVMGDAELKYFIAANAEIYNKVKACAEGLGIKEIFSIEAI